MKWKMTADGKAIQVDEKGNPISLVEKEGVETEVGIDVDHLWNKVPSLQAEAKKYREAKQELEKQVKLFEGIEDPEKAKEALQTVMNLDAKKLVDAGEMENLKKQLMENHTNQLNQTKKAYEDKIVNLEGLTQQKDGQIFNLMVSEQFSNNEHFAGKEPLTTLPPEIAKSYFGKHFRVEPVEEGSNQLTVVGYLDEAGKEKIYSQSQGGALAGFNEALKIIIDKSPFKKSIMHASSGGGDQRKPGQGNNGNILTLSREQARDPAAYQQAKAQAAEKGLQLVIQQE